MVIWDLREDTDTTETVSCDKWPINSTELWNEIPDPAVKKNTDPTKKTTIPILDTLPEDIEARIEYATRGCPVDCGAPWTREQIEAALERGPHKSATEPAASADLWKEAVDKLGQGFAQIVPWKTIKDDLPAALKLSPIAMIPHNSQKFRAILDLSFSLRLYCTEITSVNDATNKDDSPTNAMGQLGQVLPRLIAKMAEASSEGGPLLFAKLDIKDGYWRMVVAKGEE
eukprot:scaffold47191_cov34-Attheya_sp.AAC.2